MTENIDDYKKWKSYKVDNNIVFCSYCNYNVTRNTIYNHTRCKSHILALEQGPILNKPQKKIIMPGPKDKSIKEFKSFVLSFA